MKYLWFLVLVGLLSLQAPDTQEKLSATSIEFEFVKKGVDGTLAGFQSQSSINTEDLTQSVFSGSVEVETIKTGMFLRDWSLKGRKYFDADSFPKISFKSKRIEKKGQDYLVTGDLTIKGNTRPFTISFRKNGDQLLGKASLNTVDYGITILKKNKEDNEVSVSLVFDLK